jgi:hypothetical protein
MGGIAETSVAARGVRRVMVPCGRNTGVAPQRFWHTCTWTCVQAGLADLVGSRLVGGIAEGSVGARGLGYVMLECTDRLNVVLTLTQYPE